MAVAKETQAAIRIADQFDILPADKSTLKPSDKGFKTGINIPFNLGISSGLGVFPYLPAKLHIIRYGLYLAPNPVTRRVVEVAGIPRSFSLTFPTGDFWYITWMDDIRLIRVAPDNDSWVIANNRALYTVRADSSKEFQFTFSLKEPS